MNSGKQDSEIDPSLDTLLPNDQPKYAAVESKRPSSDSPRPINSQSPFLPRHADKTADFFDTSNQFDTNLWAESSDEPQEQQPGQERLPDIPGYEIRGVIGRGGMGVVYHAIDVRLGREVAIKMMALSHHSSDAMSRFETEARALAQVGHPGVVRLFDVGQVDGRPFLAMEFIHGKGLDRFTGGQPLQPRKAAEFARQLAATLQACHDLGIVHRDIKPSNALVGSNGELKLTDFGLARMVDEEARRLTRTGDIMGTPAYMAPEQASGSAQNMGPLTDIYGTGAVLYELLTGRPPFASPDVLQTVMLVLSTPPVPPRTLQPGIPKDLENITLKCLQKTPEHRYLSSKELLEDLERFLRGEPVLAKPAPVIRRMRLWAKRHPAGTSIIVLCGLGLLGLISGISFHNSRLRVELERQKHLVDEGRELGNWLISDFSREIGSESGITLVRSRLGERTKTYLDQVRKEAANDARLRTTLAESLVRLAVLQGQPQSGSLGQPAAARSSLNDALEVIGQESPGESTATTVIRMNAHMRLAELDLEDSLGAAARDKLAMVRSVFNRIRHRMPHEQRISTELELDTLEVLLATQQGESTSIEQSVQRMSEVVKEKFEQESDPMKMGEILATYWRARAGWLEQQNRSSEIIEPLQNDLKRITELLGGKTANLNTRIMFANLQHPLADALARSGDAAQAMPLYESNRQAWQALLELDSHNQNALFNVAHAWQSIGEVALHNQDLELAGKAICFAKENYEAYSERTGREFHSFPQTVFLLGTFADWHRRSGQLNEALNEFKQAGDQFLKLGKTDARYLQAAGDALLQMGLVQAEIYVREGAFQGDTPPPSFQEAFDRAIASLTKAAEHFEAMKAKNLLTTQGEGQLQRARKFLEYLPKQHQAFLGSLKPPSNPAQQ